MRAACRGPCLAHGAMRTTLAGRSIGHRHLPHTIPPSGLVSKRLRALAWPFPRKANATASPCHGACGRHGCLPQATSEAQVRARMAHPNSAARGPGGRDPCRAEIWQALTPSRREMRRPQLPARCTASRLCLFRMLGAAWHWLFPSDLPWRFRDGGFLVASLDVFCLHHASNCP